MAKPLIALKNVHVRTYQELGTFEQEKTLDKQGLSPEKASAFSTLCTGMQEVRTAILEESHFFLPSFIRETAVVV